jgi:hypothetical protein
MILSPEKYQIDNARAICRLLPFWIRGRKTILFLEAVAHPLKSVHDTFKEWAYERLIDAAITSQQLSLVWYLNHRLRKYFTNPNDSFRITSDAFAEGEVIYNFSENYLSGNHYAYDLEEEIQQATENMTLKNFDEGVEYNADIVIIAPNITETSDYSENNYKNEIRRYVDAYITVPDKYEVFLVSEIDDNGLLTSSNTENEGV